MDNRYATDEQSLLVMHFKLFPLWCLNMLFSRASCSNRRVSEAIFSFKTSLHASLTKNS